MDGRDLFEDEELSNSQVTLCTLIDLLYLKTLELCFLSKTYVDANHLIKTFISKSKQQNPPIKKAIPNHNQQLSQSRKMSTQDLHMFRKSSWVLFNAFKEVYDLTGRQLERRAKKRGRKYEDASDYESHSSVDSSQEMYYHQKQLAQKPINADKKNLKNRIREKMHKIGPTNYNVKEKPKLPLSPYFLFMTKNKKPIEKKHPSMSPDEVTKLMYELWKNLNVGQRKPYNDEFEENKIIYERKMKSFLYNQEEGKKDMKDEKIREKEREKERREKDIKKKTKRLDAEEDLNSDAEERLRKTMMEKLGGLPGLAPIQKLNAPQNEIFDDPDSDQLRL